MKRQKRDRGERAYSRGYQAALQGRSPESCPFQMGDFMRQTWLNGWRAGKETTWYTDIIPESFRQTG
ncbi:MAG: ribosome modulation factor [Pseudomonadota bacterium]